MKNKIMKPKEVISRDRRDLKRELILSQDNVVRIEDDSALKITGEITVGMEYIEEITKSKFYQSGEEFILLKKIRNEGHITLKPKGDIDKIIAFLKQYKKDEEEMKSEWKPMPIK